MSKTEEPKKRRDEPTYVAYDPEDGRILGSYSHYDAERGACVRCDPEEVKKIMMEASPELGACADLKIVETKRQEGVELGDLKVDQKTRKLIGRTHRRSQSKKWPPK